MSEPKFDIFDHQGHRQEIGGLDYLNYLCDKSRSSIKILTPRGKHNIRLLIWDFEELKEYSFFRNYSLMIDNQISSLTRVLDCELIHKKQD